MLKAKIYRFKNISPPSAVRKEHDPTAETTKIFIQITLWALCCCRGALFALISVVKNISDYPAHIADRESGKRPTGPPDLPKCQLLITK
jgi:hypothetical protein